MLTLLTTTAIFLHLTDPPSIQIQEPQSLEVLEYQMLEAFDYNVEVMLPELPVSRTLDRAKLQWLHSAASLPVPVSAFADDSPEELEAAALIRFIRAEAAISESNLRELSLRMSGSQLALWRFGRANIRDGKWSSALRTLWEDRLMDEPIHPIIRGFALRHALCFALSENNEERFAELKNSGIAEETPSFFILFQKAFACLGSPLTALRLWTSSFVEVEDTNSLTNKVWICPAPDLPPPDRITAWVIPILRMPLETSVDAYQWEAKAKKILENPDMKDYKIFFAPFQSDLELLGIALFPALLELDGEGDVVSIRMGDACS